ncbi:MAG: UbiD family decarboxylase, partial [Pseudomonadota bacterium]|nr:UbiD family decarboxylase [Pseudomonadota bacterium]
MKYRDLRDFVASLEADGDLVRIKDPVSTRLEMTAISDFVLRQAGPALLFERSPGYKIPVLTNLFGTPQRVARAMGGSQASDLRDVGELLANLK